MSLDAASANDHAGHGIGHYCFVVPVGGVVMGAVLGKKVLVKMWDGAVDSTFEMFSYARPGFKAAGQGISTSFRVTCLTLGIPLKVFHRGLREGCTYIFPGIRQTGRGVVESVKGTYHAACVAEPIIEGTAAEFSSYTKSGGREVVKASRMTLVGGLNVHDVLLKDISDFILENGSYAISGTYQLYYLALSIRELAEDILRPETAKNMAEELASYAVSGKDEMIKVVSGAPEAADQATVGIRNLIQDVVKEQFSYAVSGGREGVKGTKEALDGTWNATELPRELIEALSLEAMSYLLAGGAETLKGLRGLLVGTRNVVGLPVLTTIALGNELLAYLSSGLREGIGLIQNIPKATAAMGRIPLEVLGGIMAEVASYLLSGGNELLQGVGELREGNPYAYRHFVQDPFDEWWAPKKQAISAWIATWH